MDALEITSIEAKIALIEKRLEGTRDLLNSAQERIAKSLVEIRGLKSRQTTTPPCN